MAIRVGQINAQYAADTADASDVRVTRVFAQVVTPSTAAGITKSVTDNIFADAGDSTATVESFNLNVTDSIFSGTHPAPTYDPLFNRFVTQNVFGDNSSGLSAEAIYRAIVDSLGLTASSNPDEERSVTQYLGFTDRTNRSVLHQLFAQTGQTVTYPTIEETVIERIFDLSNSSTVTRGYNATDTFGFTATVSRDDERSVEQSLNLNDSVDISSTTFGRNVTQNLFNQHVSYTIDGNACREVEFAPLIGSTDSEEYDEFLVERPTIAAASGVSFSYPTTSPTDTLNLELPEFGNVEVNNFQRIDRATRGGNRKIYTDPAWASWDRFEISISGVYCNVTIDNIIDFLNTTLGKEVRFTDHESRQWLGVIVAPETEVEQRVDGLAVSIVFEGRVATLEVQHGQADVYHDVDANGVEIDVVYEE